MGRYRQIKGFYENNEYSNMPSMYNMGERLTTKSKNNVNWHKVDEIVKKYNLRYCIINGTFGCYGENGVYASHFIIYHKLLIDEDWYQAKLKNKEYDAIHKWMQAESLFFQLFHDCIHELDEETELHFDTGWAGNVGFFGSHDVRRNTYSFGDRFTSWKTIIDIYDPMIYDTKGKLEKGVYIMMSSNHLKDNLVEY